MTKWDFHCETGFDGSKHWVVNADCLDYLFRYIGMAFDLTFFDPPFNQGKDYRCHLDCMEESGYWDWMREICRLIYGHSSDGAAIYFMQREKNAHRVMLTLEEAGWTFQNLIIWKKMTSAVHMKYRHGKAYQAIAFYTKGERPRVFNKLRIDPPLLPNQKHPRKDGMYVTDVWDDIRELTAGFYAGKEPLRTKSGERVHAQQSPVNLLARIILASSNPWDFVFDPFAGTGTTTVVAQQTCRSSFGIELDPANYEVIHERLSSKRDSDDIDKLREYYRFTPNLDDIWPRRKGW